MVKYDVEIIDPHGEDPAGKMKDRIEFGASQGKVLVTVIPFFNQNMIVWQVPSRETRG